GASDRTVQPRDPEGGFDDGNARVRRAARKRAGPGVRIVEMGGLPGCAPPSERRAAHRGAREAVLAPRGRGPRRNRRLQRSQTGRGRRFVARRISDVKHVRVERRGATLEVTIDRPPANAITPEVSDDLHEAYCTLRDDPKLRVGIVTGAG